MPMAPTSRFKIFLNGARALRKHTVKANDPGRRGALQYKGQFCAPVDRRGADGGDVIPDPEQRNPKPLGELADIDTDHNSNRGGREH